MDEEGLQNTSHHLIHIGHPIDIDEAQFESDLEALIAKVERNEPTEDIRKDIKNICPTYNPFLGVVK